MFELDLIKVLVPWLVSFLFGFFITPVVLAYLYKYKVWRIEEKAKSLKLPDDSGKIKNVINNKTDFRVPRMGGIVIILAVLFTTVLFWVISLGVFGGVSGKIDFLSRDQTWVPLVTFMLGAIAGFIDDVFTVKNIKIGKYSGLPMIYRVISTVGLAFVLAYWFYSKLEMSGIQIPFYGYYELGLWFIPFFVFVFWSSYATSNIDGIDGLSGGIMSVIYAAFGFIAFEQGAFNISAFCFVVVGGILAFLWFNIEPAKFYMSEVGYNALSMTLVVIIFQTNTVVLAPIIAIVLFVNLVATTLQLLSIKLFKKRIFKAAPLHHHLELSGWSKSQIVLRYWIISIIAAIFGVSLAIISL